MLVTADTSWFENPAFSDASIVTSQLKPGFRDWTDDYSNVVQIVSGMPDWVARLVN